MGAGHRFRVEELRESGGSSVAVNHRHGFIDAHVGTREYVASHSYMYENPGLLGHVESAVSPETMIAYINNLRVDPAARRAGLGSALMRRMLRELRERGAVHVYGHMAEWRGKPKERLARWLERFGFEVVDCCREDELPVVALTLHPDA